MFFWRTTQLSKVGFNHPRYHQVAVDNRACLNFFSSALEWLERLERNTYWLVVVKKRIEQIPTVPTLSVFFGRGSGSVKTGSRTHSWRFSFFLEKWFARLRYFTHDTQNCIGRSHSWLFSFFIKNVIHRTNRGHDLHTYVHLPNYIVCNITGIDLHQTRTSMMYLNTYIPGTRYVRTRSWRSLWSSRPWRPQDFAIYSWLIRSLNVIDTTYHRRNTYTRWVRMHKNNYRS